MKRSAKVVVLTGVSRGLGLAMTEEFIGRGHIVIGCARSSEVLKKLQQRHPKPNSFQQVDVAVEAEVKRWAESVIKQHGAPDLLINNAAVTGGFARVDSIGSAALTQMLAVNVVGTMLCAREAVRRMSTKKGGSGGAIVNISSIAARTGSAGEWVHYAASKGAVNTFTIGLAREVAAEGIRVNAVAPGLVETQLHAANGEPGRIARLNPSIPMQRAGTADEIAQGVLWLLSGAASYTTGTILEIGGGR